jgi:hypothetical protein
LSPSKQTAEQAEFIAHVDGELFFALVGFAFAGSLKQKMKQEFGLIRLLRFAWDRMKLMKGAKPTPKGEQAKAMVQAHLNDMEVRLSQPFVFGDTPTLADFTAYHGLWFLYAVGEHPGIESYPNIQTWMAKMAALGSAQVSDITAADSLRIARDAAPLDQGSGKEAVSIVPDDYGLLPVSGQLVREDEFEYVIARQSKKAGLVHVHFPREGFNRQ